MDTIESIRRYEADAARVVVLDDFTLDCRAPRVQARFPEVDVIRACTPTFGMRLSPAFLRAYEIVTDKYDFEVLIKLDTDALVIGRGLSSAAVAVFEQDRLAGTLGTLYHSHFHRPELIHSGRWSRRMRRLARATASRGYSPLLVNHGGVYVISRAALEAACAGGQLGFRQPWWSRQGEDLIFAMLLAQVGYRPRQWDMIACTSLRLTASLDELTEGPALAIHSVRAGISGESEATIRAYFRAMRRA